MQKVLLLVVVLALVLLGGGYAGYRGYKSARQAKLIKQARDYLAISRVRKAQLCLQRALRYNPKDVEACRLMADLQEAAGSPAALFWRSKVVDLNPHSTDDRLALARTAILSLEYGYATNALEGVDAAGTNTAAYHNIAGIVAAAANQPAQADSHFLEAVRLEPQNPTNQLYLSAFRLSRTNAPALAEARSALKRVSANPTNSTLRCLALRELAYDSLRHKQFDAALALSRQLLQETNSEFRDRFLQLQVLRESKSAEYKPTLATFQREAASDPVKIAELGAWQIANTNTSPAETLGWLLSLPLNTQTNQAVARVTADCYTMMKDWRGLQASVETNNWGEFEFMRHAVKARALREQGLSGAAKAEWEVALKGANNEKVCLRMLLQLAASWKWQSEGEEILWTIVNRYPDQKWAVEMLSRTLIADGRTKSLMTLYSQELKRSPSDLAMKNDVATMALLLDAKELKPHDLAYEVFQKARTNAAYASTYAFSLYKQKQYSHALEVFQTLTLEELQKPLLAGYYGLILKETGNKEKALAYLNRALKSKGPMLPEERKLFEGAWAGL